MQCSRWRHRLVQSGFHPLQAAPNRIVVVFAAPGIARNPSAAGFVPLRRVGIRSVVVDGANHHASRPGSDSIQGAPFEIAAIIEPGARGLLEQTLSRSVVGGPASVKAGLDAFIARNRPDELILTAQIFDHIARRRSFEIVAEVMREGAAATPAIQAAV